MPVKSLSRTEKVKELLEKAIKSGDCLISHLAPNAKGYVPVGIGGRLGVKWRAHRLIYCETFGDLQEDLLVLHSCDRRNCINIEHLFVGTAKDNTQDMLQKGRHKYEVHYKIKSAEEVKEMQLLRVMGWSNVEIGKRFNISNETVRVYLNKDHPRHLVVTETRQ